MFPLFWWALTSIKPYTAIFNKDPGLSSTSCRPCDNYGVTLLGQVALEIGIEGGGVGVGGGPAPTIRCPSILDSLIVAIGLDRP